VGVYSRDIQPGNRRHAAREWIVKSKGRCARWNTTVAANVYIREVLDARRKRAACRRPCVEQIGVQTKAAAHYRVLAHLVGEAEPRLGIRLGLEEMVGKASRRGRYDVRPHVRR